MSYRVYGDIQSGNCFKVRLLLDQLGAAYRWQHVDILKGESRSEAFLRLNPNGKIPLLQLEDGRCLAESNAILHYLAEGSAFLPTERMAHAEILQWMFFEQYSHEPNIATARYIIKYLGRPAEREADLQKKMQPGYKALAVMEQHLASRQYFVAERYSIADIALYAYTHVAHEGGFELANYPAVRDWLARVAAQPGYRGMDA